MSKQYHIDKLNELLKGEYMAIGVYDKTEKLQKDSQVADALTRFKQDHQRHADQLTQRITDLGGSPNAETGMAGVMANITSEFNSLWGPKHLLKQIYNGEDKGIHAYEDRIDELDEESKTVVKQIMKEDHEHLKWLKARMEEEKSKQPV